MTNEYFDQIIRNEILVDCYNDEEDQRMSWYYCAEERMEFPFQAYVGVKNKNGDKTLKQVVVQKLVNTTCGDKPYFALKVVAEFDHYLLDFSLLALERTDASEETTEFIEMWKYWIEKTS